MSQCASNAIGRLAQVDVDGLNSTWRDRREMMLCDAADGRDVVVPDIIVEAAREADGEGVGRVCEDM